MTSLSRSFFTLHSLSHKDDNTRRRLGSHIQIPQGDTDGLVKDNIASAVFEIITPQTFSTALSCTLTISESYNKDYYGTTLC